MLKVRPFIRFLLQDTVQGLFSTTTLGNESLSLSLIIDSNS